jgi:hypothetical protein
MPLNSGIRRFHSRTIALEEIETNGFRRARERVSTIIASGGPVVVFAAKEATTTIPVTGTAASPKQTSKLIQSFRNLAEGSQDRSLSEISRIWIPGAFKRKHPRGLGYAI